MHEIEQHNKLGSPWTPHVICDKFKTYFEDLAGHLDMLDAAEHHRSPQSWPPNPLQVPQGGCSCGVCNGQFDPCTTKSDQNLLRKLFIDAQILSDDYHIDIQEACKYVQMYFRKNNNIRDLRAYGIRDLNRRKENDDIEILYTSNCLDYAHTLFELVVKEDFVKQADDDIFAYFDQQYPDDCGSKLNFTLNLIECITKIVEKILLNTSIMTCNAIDFHLKFARLFSQGLFVVFEFLSLEDASHEKFKKHLQVFKKLKMLIIECSKGSSGFPKGDNTNNPKMMNHQFSTILFFALFNPGSNDKLQTNLNSLTCLLRVADKSF